ncbi:MAG: hypothetical protein JSV08_00565 [Acidobacteriota bacterium]|nr:MAG: hypothetical protein JSV08_00565 [Acidobacteriota bacterium]
MQARKERQWIRVHLFVWMIALVVAPSVSAKTEPSGPFKSDCTGFWADPDDTTRLLWYLTPEFRRGLSEESFLMTLALLPPHAEFIKTKAVMKEQLVEECEALEDAAASWIAERLGGKGYTVRALTVEELEKNPVLLELVRKVNDRYGEEWQKIIQRPGMIEYGRYSMGDDVRKLCSLLDVEGLVIARIHAFVTTLGRGFMEELLNRENSEEYVSMDVSVVNGKTGTVEAYFYHARSSYFRELTRKPNKVMKVVSEKTLCRYPDVAEILARRERKGVNLPGEEEGRDEEDSVGEFEALLGEDEEEEPSAVEDTESASEESQSEEGQESDTAQDTGE